MSQAVQLLLVGCGKMGFALLERWREQKMHQWHISVIEPNPQGREMLRAFRDVSVYEKLEDIAQDFMPQCIIFAVKPQSMPLTLPHYGQRFAEHPLYVTIAAGKTLGFYAQHLGEKARVIRAMPNTPAMVGMGITTLFAGAQSSIKDRDMASALLTCVGEVVWLDKESLMDAATAISGSGPAYVYYFMECLMRAGIEAGLSEEVTKTLVMHMVHGSCELAFMSPDSIETLRHNVTSPGGTTEAALERLMSTNGMLRLVQEAVQAAVARARQLSS
jgi:pyrroline-5-carboxylate reductase